MKKLQESGRKNQGKVWAKCKEKPRKIFLISWENKMFHSRFFGTGIGEGKQQNPEPQSSKLGSQELGERFPIPLRFLEDLSERSQPKRSLKFTPERMRAVPAPGSLWDLCPGRGRGKLLINHPAMSSPGCASREKTPNPPHAGEEGSAPDVD